MDRYGCDGGGKAECSKASKQAQLPNAITISHRKLEVQNKGFLEITITRFSRTRERHAPRQLYASFFPVPRTTDLALTRNNKQPGTGRHPKLRLAPLASYVGHMRRQWWVTIPVLSGVVLVLAIVWPQRGPAHQGEPLSVWLRGFDGESPEGRLRSAEAVRHIGTNAVPLLISQLSHSRPGPEPWWEREVRALLSRQSVVKIDLFRPWDARGEALAGLDALGPDAKGALPALEGLLHEKPPDHRALMILARIGPEAVPALTRGLTNDEKLIRLGARSCLDMMRSCSEILFPKTAEDAEFMRRTCQFNQTLLQAAFKEYKSQHPEQVLPDSFDSLPPPQLPPGFVPPETSPTKDRPASLPPASSGFE
jgi:hypothetical protein